MSLMPAEIFAEIYGFIKSLAKSTELPVKSILISLLVYAVKVFFKEAVFSCPVSGHRAYGNLFLYGPAAILFCFSLLASESFWHATTSSCTGRRVVWWKSRKYIYLAVLPPVVWLVIAFADAHYYVCARLGPIAAAKAKANTTKALENVEEDFSNAKTDSQIIAWGVLLAMMFVATIVLTIDRCIAKTSARLLQKQDFVELEAEEAVRLFNERIQPSAKEQAKGIVDHLFERYKDKSPEEQVELGGGYLKFMYPRYAGVHYKSVPEAETKALWNKKRSQEDEVRLTESGPHQAYTSIN